MDVSREAADETSSFRSLGLASQDVERHLVWSVGSLWADSFFFAYKACDACFGLWNTHSNFDSDKAWFSAWLFSSCASSQWFLENLQELAHDRGILVPVGEASVKDIFESLKKCTSLSAIGRNLE